MLKYRNDIDGLRAVAVVVVVIYHLAPSLLPSGFLGVDVFFVISGFVITQSLSSGDGDATHGWIGRFYARRMWRLLPNLLACILLTGLAVWLLVPEPSESLVAGMFAVAGMSNIHFWLTEKDYFSQALDLNTFMHTWSLGVEEQFYLVFPWLFFAVSRSFSARQASALRAAFGLLALASLIAFLVSEAYLPPETRFLMPLRLWELAAGAFTFVLYARLADRRLCLPAAGRGYWAAAAALVMVAAFFLPSGYRAATTLAAVLATVILLLLPHDSTRLRDALGSTPATYIGKRSYSIYVWHWPVVSLAYWTVGVTFATIPLLLLIIITLSLFFYSAVESPLRRMFHATSVPMTFGIFLVSCSATAASLHLLADTSSIIGIRSARQTASVAASVPAFLPLPDTTIPYALTCVVDGKEWLLTPEAFDRCTTPPRAAGLTRIWAMGDSHAGHFQALLYEMHRMTGLGIHLIETPGIAFPMLPDEVYPPRAEIWRQIRSQFRAGDVILLSRLFVDRNTHEPSDTFGAWLKELEKFAVDMGRMGGRVVVMGPPPIFEFKSLTSCFQYVGDTRNCDVSRADLEAGGIGKVYAALQAAAERSSGTILVFDTFEALCPADKDVCSPFRDGKLFMRDPDHLNAFAGQILKPFFTGFLRSHGLLAADDAGPEPVVQDFEFSDASYPRFVDWVEGLSTIEAWGRWSDALAGRTVRIQFARPLPAGTRIRLTLRPFVPNENKPLLIRLGGTDIRHVLAPGDNIIEFGVQGMSADELELVPYVSVSPKSLGLSGDARELGIGLIRMEFLQP